MNWKRLIVAATWTSMSVIGASFALQAQTDNLDRPINSSGRGTGGTHAQRPPDRVPGGSRTPDCRGFADPKPTIQQDLIALVPADDAMLGTGDRPSFWFFVPYSSAAAPLKAEFNVRNEQRRKVMEPIVITLPRTPGIVRVQLSQALPKDTFHRWSFTLICDANSPSRNPTVGGWVRRVEPTPSVRQQLQQAKQPEQVAAIYAKAGLWYDAITLLAQRRDANPQAAAAWRDLLRSQQLETVSSQPITN